MEAILLVFELLKGLFGALNAYLELRITRHEIYDHHAKHRPKHQKE